MQFLIKFAIKIFLCYSIKKNTKNLNLFENIYKKLYLVYSFYLKKLTPISYKTFKGKNKSKKWSG